MRFFAIRDWLARNLGICLKSVIKRRTERMILVLFRMHFYDEGDAERNWRDFRYSTFDQLRNMISSSNNEERQCDQITDVDKFCALFFILAPSEMFYPFSPLETDGRHPFKLNDNFIIAAAYDLSKPLQACLISFIRFFDNISDEYHLNTHAVREAYKIHLSSLQNMGLIHSFSGQSRQTYMYHELAKELNRE